MTIQAAAAELVIRQLQLLERLEGEAFPTFAEFVEEWLPSEFLNYLLMLDGGRQGASMSATVEMMYPILVVLKAGNPTFQVKEALIESLRDTEIPDLPMEMLKAPFEGLRVIVPRGTFQVPAQEVSEIFISNVSGDRFRVAFSQGEYSHYINLLTDNPEEPISEAMARTSGESYQMPAYLREEVRAESAYADYFKADVFRFALNLALYITSPDADMFRDKTAQHELHQKLQGLKGGRRRELLLGKLQKEKEKQLYIVGANVRLQKEYTAELTESGRKWVLKHRVRVMGHWRQQPYGPGKTLRRPKWIAPFWRGPSYAEMIEKGYVVK